MIAQKKPEELFPDMIGQPALKEKAAFFINNYQISQVVPHLLLVAPKGNGKTFFASQISRHLLGPNGKPKPMIEVNSSTIKSLRNFFDSVVNPFLANTEATLFLDEASEIPNDVAMALLTILNPNPRNQNSFSYNGANYLFDFKRLSFIFGTTDAQDLISPLLDRLEIVDFQEYSYMDLMEILTRNLNQSNLKINMEAILDVAKVLRGNPRSAQKMSNHIKDYLLRNNKKEFTILEWGQICKALSIKPMGLTSTEIRILQVLRDAPNSSLTKLSATLGATRECIQKYFEIYLLKNNLMEISKGSGRNITMHGRQYLENLQKMGLTA